MSNENIHPGFKQIENYDAFNLNTDRFEFQVAVFYPKENKFLKVGVIDYRNHRFEVWEERLSRWLGFNQAFLFNYKDEETFNKLYELYKTHPGRIRARSKASLLKWFGESVSRISFMETVPEELDENRKISQLDYDYFKKQKPKTTK